MRVCLGDGYLKYGLSAGGTSQKMVCKTLRLIDSLAPLCIAKPKKHMHTLLCSQTAFKSGCLRALVEEPEKSVKFAVAQLIAVLAKHEFRLQVGWPELIAFLQTGITSQVIKFIILYWVTHLAG